MNRSSKSLPSKNKFSSHSLAGTADITDTHWYEFDWNCCTAKPGPDLADSSAFQSPWRETIRNCWPNIPTIFIFYTQISILFTSHTPCPAEHCGRLIASWTGPASWTLSYKEALNIDVSRREAAEQNPACIQVRNLMRGTSGQVAAAMEINVVNVALMTRQRLIPHCGTGNWPVNPCVGA